MTFKISFLNDDGTTQAEKSYKNLKRASDELKIAYHQIRAVYLYNNNLQTVKFKHNNIKGLEKKIRITEELKDIVIPL